MSNTSDGSPAPADRSWQSKIRSQDMFIRSSISAALPVFALLGGLAQAAPVKIAVLESLSGPQASTGLAYRAAVRYAVDKLNAAGGWNGQPVQLVEYDNQGGPAGASD